MEKIKFESLRFFTETLVTVSIAVLPNIAFIVIVF